MSTRSAAIVRVCHIGKYYPPARGGIETHVQELARAQAALGADVRIICVNHADQDGHDVSWRGLGRTRTVREQDRSAASPGTVDVLRLGRQANVARLDLCARLPAALLAAIRDGVQIVHLHVPNATFLVPLLLMPPGPRLFVTHHSDIVRQRVLRYALRPLEEVLYRRADRVLTTSPTYIEGSSLLQAHASKVEVVALGIDLAAWASPDPGATARLQARLKGDPKDPLWLSVGRLVYYKGLETGVRALSAVPGRWVVVGVGPLRERLEALARATGVLERITFVGELPADELVAACHLATAMWFPSNARSEAFGLVQVEAMAAGCPVINCAIQGSGVPWVCSDGEAGLTVPPDDAAAFAVAARRLLAEPGLRQRLSAGACARARDFDQVALARRTLELYADALRSPSRPVAR